MSARLQQRSCCARSRPVQETRWWSQPIRLAMNLRPTFSMHDIVLVDTLIQGASSRHQGIRQRRTPSRCSSSPAAHIMHLAYMQQVRMRISWHIGKTAKARTCVSALRRNFPNDSTPSSLLVFACINAHAVEFCTNFKQAWWMPLSFANVQCVRMIECKPDCLEPGGPPASPAARPGRHASLGPAP